MSKTISLTKNPTLLTVILSAATLGGYVAYRLTLDAGQDVDTAAMEVDHDGMAAPALADSLPEVVLNNLAGTPTALSSFVGKPLLINFWATWCGPCLQEIPMLKAFHEEHASIDVIGIAVDRLDPVLEYADSMQFNYPVLVGQSDGMNAMAAFRNDSGGMPFSVFTSAEGAILWIHAGELHEEHLDNFTGTIEALSTGQIDLATARDRMAGKR